MRATMTTTDEDDVLRRRDRVPLDTVPRDQADLVDRLFAAERRIGELQAREARLAEAIRWAAMSARGMNQGDVADMLELLVRR